MARDATRKGISGVEAERMEARRRAVLPRPPRMRIAILRVCLRVLNLGGLGM